MDEMHDEIQQSQKFEVWERYGIQPVINGQGHTTVLGGSSLSPEVMMAREAATHLFVDMKQLLANTGEMIAPMLGAESALVTAGSATAITLGAAACLTGLDKGKTSQLPNTDGINNEVVMFKRMLNPELGHRYWRCFETVGCKLVLVGDDDSGTIKQMEDAITSKTAIIHYLPRAWRQGNLPTPEEVIELANRYKIPVFIDAAGETFPLSEMTRYCKAGADLVTYGGKYFSAPHTTGVLCGRRDLVEAAANHSFIGFQYGSFGIGRASKLAREDVVAAVEALTQWMTMDHEERMMQEDSKVRVIESMVQDIPGVNVVKCSFAMAGVGTRIENNSGPAGSMIIEIDENVVGKAVPDIVQELEDGSPSIWAIYAKKNLPAVSKFEGLGFTMVCILDGQETVIGERLRSVLSSA